MVLQPNHPASESRKRPIDSTMYRAYHAELPEGWQVGFPLLVEQRPATSAEGKPDVDDLDQIVGRIFEPCLLLVRPGTVPEQAVRELRTHDDVEQAFARLCPDRGHRPQPGHQAFALLRLDSTNAGPSTVECRPAELRVLLPLLSLPAPFEPAPEIGNLDMIVELAGRQVWPVAGSEVV